jgi:hypothetical protein
VKSGAERRRTPGFNRQRFNPDTENRKGGKAGKDFFPFFPFFPPFPFFARPTA